jgi:hypothetical protein
MSARKKEPEAPEQETAPETEAEPTGFVAELTNAEAALRSQVGNYPDPVRPGLLNAADGIKTALGALRNFESLKREDADPNG